MTARRCALVLVFVLALAGLSLLARARLGTALAGAASPAASAALEVDRAALDQLFAKMDRNGADVTSGHLVVRTLRTSQTAGRAPQTDGVEEEMWFDGVRVRIEERETAFQPHPRSTTTVYDGTRLTAVTTEPSGRAWATVHDPLTPEAAAGYAAAGIGDMLMYWPLAPSVWGAPPRGSSLAERRVWLPRLLGEEQLGGLTCTRLVLLPRGKDPDTISYESLWVAPERGYAAARFERHTVVRSEGSTYAYGETWQAEDWLHPTQGLWLPAVAVNRRYEQSLDDPGTSRLHERRSEVVSSEFNVPIPHEVFRLEVPATAERVPPGRERGRGG